MQAVRPEKSIRRPSTGEEPVSGRYCTDANIFIECWNRIYPLAVFPSLWEKIARHQNDIILIKPIYDQIVPKDRRNREKDPLSIWLGKNHFIKTSIDNETKKLSLQLEAKYQITDQSKGVDQEDLTLIAYAKIENKTVVTLEGKQDQKPREKRNYKIPLVCSEEGIPCVNFIETIKDFGIVI